MPPNQQSSCEPRGAPIGLEWIYRWVAVRGMPSPGIWEQKAARNRNQLSRSILGLLRDRTTMPEDQRSPNDRRLQPSLGERSFPIEIWVVFYISRNAAQWCRKG